MQKVTQVFLYPSVLWSFAITFGFLVHEPPYSWGTFPHFEAEPLLLYTAEDAQYSLSGFPGDQGAGRGHLDSSLAGSGPNGGSALYWAPARCLCLALGPQW